MLGTFINVVIYDGNRKINWDYKETVSLQEAIDRWGFKRIKDTVRVNGFPVSDSKLYHKLSSFVQASKEKDAYNGRLYVTFASEKEKKQNVH